MIKYIDTEEDYLGDANTEIMVFAKPASNFDKVGNATHSKRLSMTSDVANNSATAKLDKSNSVIPPTKAISLK